MSSPAVHTYADAIVETVREPLVVLDDTMQIQRANRAFYSAFALEPAATGGANLFEIDNGRWNTGPLHRLLGEILPNETVVEDVPIEQDLPSLGKRHLMLNARRLADAGTQRPLILLAMQDITEQIEYRQELENLNAELESRVAQRTAELEQANKELEGFSYSVSHDLRAPLRAVDGFSRILLDDYAEELPEEASRYLGLVRSSAQRMGELVDDLLAFSRMSRRSLQRRHVEPGGLVDSALADARGEWPGHEPRVQVDSLPDCYADPKLLRQVFFNLLSNAFKFTSKQDEPWIHVGARQSDRGWPIYFVADNGAGFDEQYVHKLFAVFQRLHHESEFPGTGVGLALVQRIIERHGGRVWAAGEVGAGARFSLELPSEVP